MRLSRARRAGAGGGRRYRHGSGAQGAVGLGARVIAGVADTAQVSTATEAGAPETVVLQRGCAKTIREMTGGAGVDGVLPVGRLPVR